MAKYFAILLLLTISLHCLSQGKHSIISLDSLYEEYKKVGLWDSSLKVLHQLKNTNQDNYMYMHEIAMAHAIKGEVDSAYTYLFYIADNYPTKLQLKEPLFYSLITSPQWQQLVNKYFSIPKLNIKILDKDYAQILLDMYIKDQAFYKQIELEEGSLQPNKTIINKYWKIKEQLNKENLQQLENLINTKGWPKFNQVSPLFTSVAFLVIQHSEYNTMKKYYHYIHDACNQGEGDCASAALLYDRIKIHENKPQRYGSQIKYDEITKKYTLYPLEDTLQVNEYREYMGLGPLEEYIQKWGIDINVPKRKDPMAYADSVIYYKDSGTDTKFAFPHGSFITEVPEMIALDPKYITGKNKQWILVMPAGSVIVLKFIDNQIVNYPYQADIFIKEEGPSGDKAIVYVSNDGIQFDSLGITIGGRTSTLDLENIQYTLPVKYIKLVSLNNNGSLPGFDLVYVKGTPKSSVSAIWTTTEIKTYLQAAQVDEIFVSDATLKHNETYKIQDILFNKGEYNLTNTAKNILKLVIKKLKEDTKCKIELNGHTDDVGNKLANENLSLRRALEVADFLIAHGISQSRIFTYGFSSEKPKYENSNNKNRSGNRRVELVIFY